MEGPYQASFDSEAKLFVKGPGSGLGYYGGTLFPHLRFDDQSNAERAATVANIAYAAGYEQAQKDIRKALGLTR